MLALGSGGFFGVGLRASEGLLPAEASTDMIFAIIGEELGLVGAFAVLAAFVVFGYAGFNVALACRDPFGKLLAAGITALICGQPSTSARSWAWPRSPGIPLPFAVRGLEPRRHARLRGHPPQHRGQPCRRVQRHSS